MVEFSGEVFRIGDMIHGQRVKSGYKTIADFSDAIYEATGVTIPKDTLQRIESGRQEPKVSQYIAIAITLGVLFDPLLVDSLPTMLRRAREEMLESSEMSVYGGYYLSKLNMEFGNYSSKFIRDTPSWREQHLVEIDGKHSAIAVSADELDDKLETWEGPEEGR